MSQATRTARYREVLLSASDSLTVRAICDRAGIAAEEAKFVSSGLEREVKLGRAEKTGQVTCPVTQRKSLAYRLTDAGKAPRLTKASAPKPAKVAAVAIAPSTSDPSNVIPDPKIKPRKRRKA